MTSIRRTLALSFVFTLAALAAAASASAAEWTPRQWVETETLQFRSVCPDEGEHWSYVWLVVLDGDVFLRLGTKAASRIDCNESKMATAVKIEGETFDVDMVQMPEMSERVAEAMADKYMSDFLVAWMSHPYTLKLVPRAPADAAAAEPAPDGAAEAAPAE